MHCDILCNGCPDSDIKGILFKHRTSEGSESLNLCFNCWKALGDTERDEYRAVPFSD